MSFDDIKKKLNYDGDDVLSSSGTGATEEAMQVYLRIRPFTSEDKAKGDKKGAMELSGKTKVSLRAPKDAATTTSSSNSSVGSLVNTFTFSQVYDETCSQQEVFDSTMLPMLKQFIGGHDCLVFAYGMTNSGKTFTMQGTAKEQGIIPRSLAMIFKDIENQHYHGMNLKPVMFSDFTRLSEKEVTAEIATKSTLFNLETMSHGSSQASLDSEDVSSEMNADGQSDEPLFVATDQNAKYSVWISFAEIYNEQLYDLLEPPALNRAWRRRPLKMAEDKNGQPYAKDLRSVCVCSAEDACRLMAAGQRNLQYACTKLNESSSRSHCILTVKLVHVIEDVTDVSVSSTRAHVTRINALSFCDLAGSERCNRTQSAGDRLKEAAAINTSMLTLGRCISALRDVHQQQAARARGAGQHQPAVMVPFRESKLTRLFQNFFCGRGKVSMFVNVSQCFRDYEENLHALKFSAVAQESAFVLLKPEFKMPKRRKSSRLLSLALAGNTACNPRPSIPWATPGTIAALGEVGEVVNALIPHEIVEEDEEPPAVAEDTGTGKDEEEMTDGGETSSDSEDEAILIYQQREQQFRTVIEKLSEALRTARGEIRELKQSLESCERNVRAEVCAAWKEEMEKMDERHRERLEEEREAAQHLMDSKVELIEGYVHRTHTKRQARKRRRPGSGSSSDEDEAAAATKRATASPLEATTLAVQFNDQMEGAQESELADKRLHPEEVQAKKDKAEKAPAVACTVAAGENDSNPAACTSDAAAAGALALPHGKQGLRQSASRGQRGHHKKFGQSILSSPFAAKHTITSLLRLQACTNSGNRAEKCLDSSCFANQPEKHKHCTAGAQAQTRSSARKRARKPEPNICSSPDARMSVAKRARLLEAASEQGAGVVSGSQHLQPHRVVAAVGSLQSRLRGLSNARQRYETRARKNR